ncbi:MAG TPA: AmmeMemoRadiSam system protein B [bacterium]|nr:AmmeMemoRadiSam system protein B [bacterium]
MSNVKKAALAGQWYSGNPRALQTEIQSYLDQANVPEIRDEILAVMSPHAGYTFSGPVAGFSYRALQGRGIDTAIVLAVCHSGAAEASILDMEACDTPLGRIDIDRELVSEFRQSIPGLPYIQAAHTGVFGRPENSAEMQIPFIQTALPGTRLVEILIGGQDPELGKEIGNGIASVLKNHPEKKVVLIASSDMTHYPPYEDAVRIDGRALEALVTLDEEHIRNRLAELEREPVRGLRCVLCGAGAVLVALRVARNLGADRAEILAYRNSGDSTYGSRDEVVGYGSLAVYRSTAGASISTS